MVVEIVVNARVVTSDGTELGRVKQVETSAFLVNAPRQFDYWLSATLVGSADADKVDLVISESDVAAYKMDNPNDHNQFMADVPEKLKMRTVQGDTLRR